MQTHHLFLFLLLLFCPTFFSFATASPSKKTHTHAQPQDLVRSSCIHTRYPGLCLRTLSNYAGPANTPLDVARAALRVSLAHARRASQYLKTLSTGSPGHNNPTTGTTSRQRVALRDCAEQMDDSVDELTRSLRELRNLRPGTFRWQMSNAQTWVSAALTDGETCLDGFSDGGEEGVDEYDGGKVRKDVKKRVSDVARVTSNALYMINKVSQSGIGKVMHRHRSVGSSSKN